MLDLNDLLGRIDWKAVREWLSPLIAFASVCWAIHESREKRREMAARADDAKKYTEALETVIEYGRFVQHLEGVDKRVGAVADQLSQITTKVADVATRTAEIAQIAVNQTSEALKSLAGVSAAATDVAELTQIGRTALRSQRDAVRAHKNLVGEITAENKWDFEFPEYDVAEITKGDVDSALRQKLLEWLKEASAKGTNVIAGLFVEKYTQGYALGRIVNELGRMKRDRLITISSPSGAGSTISLTENLRHHNS